MKYHTRLGFSGERHNALTVCARHACYYFVKLCNFSFQVTFERSFCFFSWCSFWILAENLQKELMSTRSVSGAYRMGVYYLSLYNNTCSFCIFIGRELCVIKVHTHGWRQLMAWSNLANLFRGSSHGFWQLYYNIKQIDFIFLCFCTVIDHRWRHSVWRTKSHALDCVSCVLFCSSHAMTSSVIYYSTDARKNEIYLLNKDRTFNIFMHV